MNEVKAVGLDLAKRVSGSRCRCEGTPGSEKQASARRCAELFPQAPAMPRWHGGLRLVAYWAREIRDLGHDVRMIPASYVKPYVAPQIE